MKSIQLSLTLGLALVSIHSLRAQSVPASQPRTIVLVAGETAKVDKLGHHDYLAGCKCLEELLGQTSNVKTVQVTEGWPEQESVWDQADAIVFYTDGGGKQAFLSTPTRLAKIQSLVDRGVGLVMLHQAVDFPAELAPQAKSWIGGLYLAGASERGHWPSNHVDFPQHPITRGVSPWQINDGWLNDLEFVEAMKDISPLVWSGKKYAGSRAGLNEDIVAWAYERPLGGRSFSFTGLDAHAAWSLPGMRQLVVNGVLWSAGVDIPTEGATCKMDDQRLEQMQTPRETPKPVASK